MTAPSGAVTVTERYTVRERKGERPAAWGTAKRQTAWWLAIGASREYAAQQTGITRTTLYRWLEDPVFAAEIERLHIIAVERVEPTIMGNVEFALDIQRRVMTGEIPANDDRATTADRLIGRILDRLLAVVAPAPPGPGVTVAPVQVNVHAGSG